MKKANFLEVWLDNYQKNLNDHFPSELRNGSFEFGYINGARECLQFLLKYLEHKADKVAFLNNERYYGACDLIEILKDDIEGK